MPGLSAIRILSESIRKAEGGVSGSGTCFTQTMMLATAPSSRTGLPEGVGEYSTGPSEASNGLGPNGSFENW